MTIVQVNYVYDPSVTDPDALLDLYSTLTGWSDALLAAGAASVRVVQRFSADAVVSRRGVEYVFRTDRMHQAVAASGADIVHVNSLGFPVQTWLLRRALPSRTAIVVQDHADGLPGRASSGVAARVRVRIARAGLRAADGLLFTTLSHADEWRRARLITERQQTRAVLEASTDLRQVPRLEARRLSDLRGEPAILWVGRLNANKDPLTVLDGCEEALTHLPDAVLTMIYQQDDLLDAVRARLDQSRPLRERVRLLGRVPHEQLAAFYSAADLFVLGSHHEGSGYSVLEACACGLAPVVTDIPSFRAITGTGSIGALWPAGDAAALARALVAVSREERAARRERVSRHFAGALSWGAVGAAAMEAYSAIIARRAGAAKP